MATILCNVFTTAMLSTEEHQFNFTPISLDQAREELLSGFQQAVGHPATTEVLSSRLGLEVRPVRANVHLNKDDVLIVAQVVIPRLAEGEILSPEQVASCPMNFWRIQEQ